MDTKNKFYKYIKEYNSYTLYEKEGLFNKIKLFFGPAIGIFKKINHKDFKAENIKKSIDAIYSENKNSNEDIQEFKLEMSKAKHDSPMVILSFFIGIFTLLVTVLGVIVTMLGGNIFKIGWNQDIKTITLMVALYFTLITIMFLLVEIKHTRLKAYIEYAENYIKEKEEKEEMVNNLQNGITKYLKDINEIAKSSGENIKKLQSLSIVLNMDISKVIEYLSSFQEYNVNNLKKQRKKKRNIIK
ncbi:hypothetical protein [Terrisporobacter vanillatitrophus]|uniref:hypothetical protein n=1 Tax=Terrisporobacter vanillatitrophus TaxID=3058402 RepID=UPI0033670CF1